MVYSNRLQNSKEQPLIKEVKKLSDWSISFPYAKKISTWEILNFDFKIKKDWKNIFIENITVITEKNKGYVKNKDEKILLDPTSTDTFLKSLGAALDEYIGKGRLSAVEKGKEIYRLLGYWPTMEKEKQEQEAKEETKRALEALKNAQNFKWDSKEKTLQYNYIFGTRWWQGAVITFKYLENTKTTQVTIEAHNTLKPGSNKIQEMFSDKDIDQIPVYLQNTFNDGIKLSTWFWIPSGTLQKKSEKFPQTSQNIKTKAENAIKAYRYYLRQEQKEK